MVEVNNTDHLAPVQHSAGKTLDPGIHVDVTLTQTISCRPNTPSMALAHPDGISPPNRTASARHTTKTYQELPEEHDKEIGRAHV